MAEEATWWGCAVWRQLELENITFFKAYNDRLAAKVPCRSDASSWPPNVSYQHFNLGGLRPPSGDGANPVSFSFANLSESSQRLCYSPRLMRSVNAAVLCPLWA